MVYVPAERLPETNVATSLPSKLNTFSVTSLERESENLIMLPELKGLGRSLAGHLTSTRRVSFQYMGFLIINDMIHTSLLIQFSSLTSYMGGDF